jgi:hypothetical protein
MLVPQDKRDVDQDGAVLRLTRALLPTVLV